MASQKARCEHCGEAQTKSHLTARPEGGAICREWFECQRRVDKRRGTPRVRRFRSIPG